MITDEEWYDDMSKFMADLMDAEVTRLVCKKVAELPDEMWPRAMLVSGGLLGLAAIHVVGLEGKNRVSDEDWDMIMHVAKRAVDKEPE